MCIRDSFNALTEGEFRPLKISKDVRELFEIKSQELGRANPFDAAEDVLSRIADVLEAVPVTADFFPEIINPFDTILPDLVGALNNQLPPLPGADLQALNTGTQYGNIDPVTQLTTAEQVYLSPLEKIYQANKRRRTPPNQNITRTT